MPCLPCCPLAITTAKADISTACSPQAASAATLHAWIYQPASMRPACEGVALYAGASSSDSLKKASVYRNLIGQTSSHDMTVARTHNSQGETADSRRPCHGIDQQQQQLIQGIFKTCNELAASKQEMMTASPEHIIRSLGLPHSAHPVSYFLSRLVATDSLMKDEPGPASRQLPHH